MGTGLIAAAAIGSALAAAWLFRYWKRTRILPRVLVVLKSGETVGGVLVSAGRSSVIVGNAAIMERGQDPVKADGSVHVDRANVRWIQRPEA